MIMKTDLWSRPTVDLLMFARFFITQISQKEKLLKAGSACIWKQHARRDSPEIKHRQHQMYPNACQN